MRLVVERLPIERDVHGDHDAWPLVGAGLVSRTTTTMQHLLDAQRRGRMADGSTLARSLFEHVVHLAWLAANPSAARIQEWRRYDLRSRVVAADDAAQRGIELISPPDLAQLKAQVAGLTGRDRLTLETLTIEADKHWANRLPGMGTSRQKESLRGFYAILYRNYSGVAHPSFRGLNPVVEDVTGTRKRVVLEKHYAGSGPYGMATIIYAFGLYISSASLGWPDAARVSAAFDRYADPR
jgi:Family of unknown function (DUF5677)